MTNDSLYMQSSFELNLFFLRIMKEHALFIQLGFTLKNADMAAQAQEFRERLDDLFKQTIHFSKGYVSDEILRSGELFTQFTEEAEQQTQKYTGVPIDTALTAKEYDLGGGAMPPASMRQTVDQINEEALALLEELQSFQKRLLEGVLSCRIFTISYPLIINHIIRETELYMKRIRTLKTGILLGSREFALEQAFWNNNLGEHAAFSDGFLDPTEQALKRQAGAFAKEFISLEYQAQNASKMLQILPEVTMRSEAAAKDMKDFDAQGTKGLLTCRVRSVIIPILADHGLRENNHYLRILNKNMSVMELV